MSDSQKKAVLPYATYQSFANFVGGLREHGMPKHITRSMLPGSNSGKASMSAALTVLKLVNESSEPTPLMRELANPQSNYSEVLRKVIHGAYPFLADGSLDLAHTTTDKVVEQIKEYGASGSTVTKCVAFLLSAAKDADIPVSRYVKTPQPPNKGPGNAAKRKASKMPLPPTGDGNEPLIPARPIDKEKIVVSAHGMEEWEIWVPKGLSNSQWRHGLKMAKFILDNYRALESDEPEGDAQ